MLWKWVLPPVLGLLFLSSMAVELWNAADAAWPAWVVVFGWMIALLPTLGGTIFFLRQDVLRVLGGTKEERAFEDGVDL